VTNKKLPALMLLGLSLLPFGCASDKTASSGEMKSGVSNVSNQFWWPERLDLAPLRQHSEKSDPMGKDFNYGREFSKLDLDAVKKDVEALMKKFTGLVAC